MRLSHVTYLRTLAAGLVLNGTQPFQSASAPVTMTQSRFLEVEPPLNRFQELVPFCVLVSLKPTNIRDGRRIEKLGKVEDPEPEIPEEEEPEDPPEEPPEDPPEEEPEPIVPTKLVYLRQHFKQTFPYRLEFWLEDPAQDILSSREPLPVEEPEGPEEEPPPPAEHSYGLIDQALLYIAKNEYFTNEVSGTVRVRAGDSGLVTDPAGELSLYKLFLEIIFEDGLQEQEHIPTLAGVAFAIRNTTVEEI